MASIRRNVRLRREYLYRKNLEGKEREVYEKKRKVKEALESGKVVPTELRRELSSLRNEIELDDARTAQAKSSIDDEYARAGIVDPKILLTTSRDASSRLIQFVKEMKLVFPNSHRINRGNTVVKEIIDIARSSDFTDVVIIHEHRGEPDGMIVSHLPYGPTAYFGLSSVVLRHDLKDKLENMSEAYPHLIFDNFSTKLGERLQTVLKYLFPVPKPDSQRVMTFANRGDLISYRHHVYRTVTSASLPPAKPSSSGDGEQKQRAVKPGDIELAEVGPRFELRPYQIKLGTADMNDADLEWVLRPYMNTAKKRKHL